MRKSIEISVSRRENSIPKLTRNFFFILCLLVVTFHDNSRIQKPFSRRNIFYYKSWNQFLVFTTFASCFLFLRAKNFIFTLFFRQAKREARTQSLANFQTTSWRVLVKNLLFIESPSLELWSRKLELFFLFSCDENGNFKFVRWKLRNVSAKMREWKWKSLRICGFSSSQMYCSYYNKNEKRAEATQKWK